MTCRHKMGDPGCSSNVARMAAAELELQEAKERMGLRAEPDNSDYEIETVLIEGNHLVMKVRYPSCDNCAFEGLKILVYENVAVVDAMKWRVIDPHFVEDRERPPTQAPSPAARFPATQDGWVRALAFARSILSP